MTTLNGPSGASPRVDRGPFGGVKEFRLGSSLLALDRRFQHVVVVSGYRR